MGGLRVARRSLAIAVLATVLGVAGCAGGAQVSDNPAVTGGDGGASANGVAVDQRDAAAIAQLSEIAARDAELEGPVDATACWVPSQNPVLDEEVTNLADGPEDSGAPDDPNVPDAPNAPDHPDAADGPDYSPGPNSPDGVIGKATAAGESTDADEADFRVLCRVHFEQEGAERYRDMVCIGNLGRDPVTDYCYQWAFYADAPKFEDRPAFIAPASD